MKDMETAKRLCRKLINEYVLVISGKPYDLVSLGIHIQLKDSYKKYIGIDYEDTYVTQRGQEDKPLHWFIHLGPNSAFIDINIENDHFYGGIRINQISNGEEYGTGRVVNFIKNKINTNLLNLNQEPIRESNNALFLRKKLAFNISYSSTIERPRYLWVYENPQSFKDLFYFKHLEISTDFESLPVTSENMFFPLCSLPYIIQGKHGKFKNLTQEMVKNFIHAFKVGTESLDEFDLIKKCSILNKDIKLENCARYGFFLSKNKL